MIPSCFESELSIVFSRFTVQELGDAIRGLSEYWRFASNKYEYPSESWLKNAWVNKVGSSLHLQQYICSDKAKDLASLDVALIFLKACEVAFRQRKDYQLILSQMKLTKLALSPSLFYQIYTALVEFYGKKNVDEAYDMFVDGLIVDGDDIQKVVKLYVYPVSREKRFRRINSEEEDVIKFDSYFP
ncbi:MAG: hypothetical protein ACMZ64_12225 [Oleiphilus sp.]